MGTILKTKNLKLIVVLFLFLLNRPAFAQTLEEGDLSFHDQEYGVKLIFPKGWYMRSGYEKREELKREMEEKHPGNQRKKETALSVWPLVTIYRYNPNEFHNEKELNPHITLTVSRIPSSADALEISKASQKMGIMFSKGKVIEDAHEIIINGVRGARSAHQFPTNIGDVSEVMCLFIVGKISYELVFQSSTKDFLKYKNDFENTLNSFTLDN
jgi:hypothetical protein